MTPQTAQPADAVLPALLDSSGEQRAPILSI